MRDKPKQGVSERHEGVHAIQKESQNRVLNLRSQQTDEQTDCRVRSKNQSAQTD